MYTEFFNRSIFENRKTHGQNHFEIIHNQLIYLQELQTRVLLFSILTEFFTTWFLRQIYHVEVHLKKRKNELIYIKHVYFFKTFYQVVL